MVKIRKDFDPYERSPLYIVGNRYGTFAYSVARDSWAICGVPDNWAQKLLKATWLELLVTSGISQQQAANIKLEDPKLWYKTKEVIELCTLK